MRSRFSAFALGDADYLMTSWHPSTRPGHLDLDTTIVWRRLQIVDTEAGGVDDATGIVEFAPRTCRTASEVCCRNAAGSRAATAERGSTSMAT